MKGITSWMLKVILTIVGTVAVIIIGIIILQTIGGLNPPSSGVLT